MLTAENNARCAEWVKNNNSEEESIYSCSKCNADVDVFTSKGVSPEKVLRFCFNCGAPMKQCETSSTERELFVMVGEKLTEEEEIDVKRIVDDFLENRIEII